MNGRLEEELLAVTRKEAVAALEEAGFRVETRYTGRSGGPPGLCAAERVVRIHLRDGAAIITVACELNRQSGDREYIPEAGRLEK